MWEPDANGVFSRFQHVFAYCWANDNYLQSVIPCVEDEAENRVHLYGVNHITDEELINGTRSYAVLNDLGGNPTTTAGKIRSGPRPYRLRVYTDSLDLSEEVTKHAIEKLQERLPVATKSGSLCWNLRHSHIQLQQSQKHFFAQTTMQPQFKG